MPAFCQHGQFYLSTTGFMAGSNPALSASKLLYLKTMPFSRYRGMALFLCGNASFFASIMRLFEKLEQHEPVIKLAFRLLVLALLFVIAWRTGEAADNADAAHDVGYDAKEYAMIAAKEAEAAKSLAASARNECAYR